MNRRSFLRWTSAAGAAAVLTRYARRSWADPFGEPPAGAAAVMLPENRRARRVLEVFLYGGISPWETLYLVRNHGRPTNPQYANQQYYTFDYDGPGGTRAAYQACGLPSGGEIGSPSPRTRTAPTSSSARSRAGCGRAPTCSIACA